MVRKAGKHRSVAHSSAWQAWWACMHTCSHTRARSQTPTHMLTRARMAWSAADPRTCVWCTSSRGSSARCVVSLQARQGILEPQPHLSALAVQQDWLASAWALALHRSLLRGRPVHGRPVHGALCMAALCMAPCAWPPCAWPPCAWRPVHGRPVRGRPVRGRPVHGILWACSMKASQALRCI